MTPDDLIARLETAFADVRPGRIGIYEAEALDGIAGESELRLARSRDTFKDWREVPDSAIEACTCALTYFDPEGWRFYLPSYVRYALRNAEGSSMSIDATIYTLALDLGWDEEIREDRRKVFETLSALQASAVRDFLLFTVSCGYCYDAAAAQTALAQYWSLRVT